jgi:hypothetical protein
MLDESNGFPQYRSADLVALLQGLLRAQRLSDRPAEPDDIGLDATGNLRSALTGPALGGRTGFGTHASISAQLPARTA